MDESTMPKSKLGQIKTGDKLDRRLLFTSYNNNQLIQDQELDGKVIILIFMEPRDVRWFRYFLPHLLDMYSKLQGVIEFIFVPYGDDDINTHSRLFDIFSMVSWPVIPMSDIESRKRLQTLFGVSKSDAFPSFIIDERGEVLQCLARRLFTTYGAAAYPFTEERIRSLEREDHEAINQPSVTRILGSDDLDYLVNNKGDKVPLKSLEDKVVGLYICASLSDNNITSKLKKAYEELAKYNEPFEVVFIYAHMWYESWNEEKEMFLDTFEAMPWLALPFEDSNRTKKLQRIFKFQHQELAQLEWPLAESKLVIIGAQGWNFIEQHGANILREYGASAYPFNLPSALMLEVEMVKKVVLGQLLEDIVYGTKVPFCQLRGKRSIVVFQNYKTSHFDSMLLELKEKYLKMKDSKDEFEVIHVHDCDSVCAGICTSWLSCTPFHEGTRGYKLMTDLFPGKSDGLLAFDRDRSVVRKTWSPELGEGDFPFHAYANMELEICAEVLEKLNIPLDAADAEVRALLE